MIISHNNFITIDRITKFFYNYFFFCLWNFILIVYSNIFKINNQKYYN